MTRDTRKNYDQHKNKIRNNWEDVQYLISLHNKLLAKIDSLNAKLDRLWSSVSNIYEDKG